MEQFLTSAVRRYFEIEVPPAKRPPQGWPLLIGMHGYQGDKVSMMHVATQIAGGKMVVVSLQGPNQFFIPDGTRRTGKQKARRVGFGWGTSYRMEESVALHHSNLRALARLARREYGADGRRVFLLGFSQACAYNYRFVFTYPRAICGVISVCGGVPHDWTENPLYRPARTHVLHIAATQDQWYSRQQNLEFRRQLAERAASLDFRFYRTSHRFPHAALPLIRQWIESIIGRSRAASR